jgi:hypothetical protein
MSQIVCFLCSRPGHSASHCKELSGPLEPGFHSGGNGGGGHSHDDEDDRLALDTHLRVSFFSFLPLFFSGVDERDDERDDDDDESF